MNHYCVFKLILISMILLGQLTLSTDIYGQEDTRKIQSTDEQRLVDKIKEEVLKELQSGEFLRQQIQLGIQDYINKQREAQIAAQAEQTRLANEKIKSVRRISPTRDHIYGNVNAPVSLIEYSDYECPFCKHFHNTAKEIVNNYDGKVNWVYRHFPLTFHNPGAQKEAEASECAYELGGNDTFWKYSDSIYERTKSNGNGFPLDQLVALAKELGLDQRRFAECYESGKYERRVKEDLEEGSKIGITGTPANVILHNRSGEVVLTTGAQPIEAFKSNIEKMLGMK